MNHLSERLTLAYNRAIGQTATTSHPERQMMKPIGALLSLVVCLAGCGGPGSSPQADAQHWAAKVHPGMSAREARDVLADNDFKPWSVGRVIYGYRDEVASTNYSDGVALSVYLDDANRVAYAETYASPSSPYPMVWPTYP